MIFHLFWIQNSIYNEKKNGIAYGKERCYSKAEAATKISSNGSWAATKGFYTYRIQSMACISVNDKYIETSL